jgi:hypothetical protein
MSKDISMDIEAGSTVENHERLADVLSQAQMRRLP